MSSSTAHASMIISNSEAETYDTCERSHYYKFALGLQPKKPSHFIRIGVLGHKVLESFYRVGLETDNRKKWYEAGIAELALAQNHATSEEDYDIINLVTDRFNQYVRHYRTDKWRIVDVEGKHQQYLGEDITYGMTLDLLVEEMEGRYRGEYVVIDHKFCYNFQTDDELSMNSQIPKYISTLRHNGFNVKRGMLNQIRYRNDIKDDSKLFRRALIKMTDTRIDAIMREQLVTSRKIYDRVRMPVADYRDQAKRNMSKRNCGSCYFRMPCSMELDGRDMEASRVLALDYIGQTYGYRG